MTNSESDFLWGIEAIGRELGLSHPKTLKMLTAGLIPARNVGGRWVASRSKQREALLGA